MLRGLYPAVVAVAMLASATAAGGWTSRDAAENRLLTGPLQTAFVDPAAFQETRAPLALRRAKAAGAGSVLLILYWYSVTPSDKRPVGFDPTNPADPAYHWDSFDRAVKQAAAAGMKPLVQIYGAPLWAQRPGAGRATTVRPDPAELARFATAAATRYGGSFRGLPRITAWQIWNEPNLSFFLSPQYENGKSIAADWYRAMVNSASDAIHAVHADNIVVAGGTFPFGGGGTDHYPLDFMRRMLCMSNDPQPKPTCSKTSRFDAWSHHPYSQSGPNGHAVNPDSVSIADLPKMRRLLVAALASRHIQTRHPLRFWVSEFSWESKPPDPDGAPAALEARWVADGLYRMWQSGVSLVTWFLLRDEEFGKSPFQSGLHYYDGPTWKLNRPKPALGAFRFPFVAFPSRGKVFVWGRTPDSAAHKVMIEHAPGGPWKRVAVVKANAYGIFSARLEARPLGKMRARVPGLGAAIPFALEKPPDLTLPSVFGQ